VFSRFSFQIKFYYIDGQNNEPLSEVYYQERQVENFQIQQSAPTVILPPFTHYPEPCICPYCHQSIVTRIKKRNGVAVWLTSAAICFFGCALGCCLIPFCLDGIKV
jgi:lipopolysaccharide-induced tumor necrosis factor-alpha factor